MALPRKGSRRIEVDGQTFRYMTSGNDEPGIFLIVERWQEPSGKMIANFDYWSYVHNENWKDGRLHSISSKQNRMVTPGIVAQAIRAALKSGWDPGARGDFSFCGDDVVPPPPPPPQGQPYLR